jgi:flagellar hook-associated protein 3 FlgL
MRVTEQLIFQSFANKLGVNSARLLELHEQLVTGKRVNRPSDDPIDYSRSLNFRTQLSNTDQFIRNINQGLSFLNQSDAALAGVGNLLVRAKEIALSQVSSTASPQDRANASREVQGILNQIVQFANSKAGDRYIFAGFETATAPFDSAGTYGGDTGSIQIEIDPNITAAINTRGDVIFNGAGGGVDLFTILSTLQTDLQNNNVTGIDTAINSLDTALNQILSERADFGARIRRFESTRTALEDFKVNVTRLISEAEDADLAKVAADIALQQNALVALRTSANFVVGQNLLSFLR